MAWNLQVFENCLTYENIETSVIIFYNTELIPGGGGTPTHYLYGYVLPNGVVILKLLV